MSAANAYPLQTHPPQDRDEGSNLSQAHDPELVKEELRPLVFDEVRRQVR
jgi:hypothetical protein